MRVARSRGLAYVPAMRVWLTGGSGFVGQRLAARLRRDGHEVDGDAQEVDVTDKDAIAAQLRGFRPDAIAHLAGISFVPDAARDPLLAWRVNYAGTALLLASCRAHAPAARVLVVTSAMVYGTAEANAPLFDETSPLRPIGPYATTKAAADVLAGEWALRGLDVVRLRPFNHTGAGRPDRFVESSFARQLVEMERGDREPEMQVGNLDAVRDFLHVEDVVDAYVRLLEPGGPTGAFNVASGEATRIGALLDRLVAMSTATPQVVTDPARWRPTDANAGTASRLREAVGWAPAHTLDETLEELLGYWRAELR